MNRTIIVLVVVSWWCVALIMPTARVSAAGADAPSAPAAPPEGGYEVHDKRRPQPAVVTPPTPSTQEQVGKAPSDAVVLFDGTDLSKWSSVKTPGQPAPWKVVDGDIETVAKSGYIQSNEQFADCQAHV